MILKVTQAMNDPFCHKLFVLSNFLLFLFKSTSGSNPAAYLSDEERIRAWEIGHPDYLGVDAFENIQKAIDKALQ